MATIQQLLSHELLVISGSRFLIAWTYQISPWRVRVSLSKSTKPRLVKGTTIGSQNGVERTLERKLFSVEVSEETENTLLSLIRTYVQPGSIILADCFHSSTNLSQYYPHFIVNHSNKILYPQTDACIKAIDSTWRSLKYKISPRNRTNSLDEN
ncbi:hypothetical protein HZS_2710 [Henneguya salminicola]|nr:hypothetical protein HZS_2710 [Henneguya salminicola]